MLFTKYKNNPIIHPDPQKPYEAIGTFNPAAAVHNNKIYIIYRALNKSNVSSLCLAVSNDGYNFTKSKKNPIIKPTRNIVSGGSRKAGLFSEPNIPEEKGGCEDPRITKIGHTYYLLYTSYNGGQPVTPETINESLATSNDLVNWEKQGILIKGSKSATLFSEKINGEYVMFIGGADIRVATSKNLKSWKIDKKPILNTREDKFDSIYVEVGPPPFQFKDKLVLFFNTTDKNRFFQPSLALLDKNNPRKILYRADKPFMTITEEYERNGHVKNVIFGCGLVEFKRTYFYYYGGADTTINVATVSKKKMEKYLSSLLLD